MTANMIKGKGFRGALRYNLEKVGKGFAEVLGHSFVEVSEKSIMKEVQMIKVLRPNLQKFFYHTSINFPPNEDLSNQKMREIGFDYLKASGFVQHQFIMFRHRDADHPHLHILVNRIGYDGEVMTDSNDFSRCEKILRELEEKYSLTKVLSSGHTRERAMTKNELEMMKRTNLPSHKMALQVIIRNALLGTSKPTTQEFIQRLAEKGVNVLFNQATTGHVSGISYGYKGARITGSRLGNDFKWTTIKNSIDYEQERDRTAIHEANTRTRSVQPDARTGPINPEGNSKALSTQSRKQPSARIAYENTRHANPEYAKTGQRGKHIARSANSKTGRDSYQASQNSGSPNLASILADLTRSDTDHNNYQSFVATEGIAKRKRKKKRKGS